MTHHTHKHSTEKPQTGRQLHKRWEVWTVIALMLAAMMFYVGSMDESVWPRAWQGNKAPASKAAPSR
jgi:hypothetical protein